MEITAFLNYLEYEKRYSAHTITAYKQDLEQFWAFATTTYDMKEWSEIKSAFLRSWVVSLMQENLNPSSIHRKISSLKTYHKFLLKTAAIPNITFPHVLLPKKAERLPAYIEEEQLDKLQTNITFPDGLEGLRDYLVLEVLYLTGMRRSELIGLLWSDINWEQRQFKVLGKGNKTRLIPFGEDLKKILLEYQKIQQENFENQAIKTVFVTDKGLPMYPKFVYNTVTKYLALITTAKKKSPHVLRHSFATHLSNNGADLNAIKELLGHANLAATQVYTHNSIEQLKKVYEQAHPKGKLDISKGS